MPNNNYTLFDVLYVDVQVKVLPEEGEIYAHVPKPFKQSYVSEHFFERDKK